MLSFITIRHISMTFWIAQNTSELRYTYLHQLFDSYHYPLLLVSNVNIIRTVMIIYHIYEQRIID